MSVADVLGAVLDEVARRGYVARRVVVTEGTAEVELERAQRDGGGGDIGGLAEALIGRPEP